MRRKRAAGQRGPGGPAGDGAGDSRVDGGDPGGVAGLDARVPPPAGPGGAVLPRNGGFAGRSCVREPRPSVPASRATRAPLHARARHDRRARHLGVRRRRRGPASVAGPGP